MAWPRTREIPVDIVLACIHLLEGIGLEDRYQQWQATSVPPCLMEEPDVFRHSSGNLCGGLGE